jgi:hypothetical protein
MPSPFVTPNSADIQALTDALNNHALALQAQAQATTDLNQTIIDLFTYSPTLFFFGATMALTTFLSGFYWSALATHLKIATR